MMRHFARGPRTDLATRAPQAIHVLHSLCSRACPLDATEVMQGGYDQQMAETEITPEFKPGWDATLVAVRQWHEDQAKKALVQSRRTWSLKNLEREAEVHARAAEMIGLLSPDDV